MSSPAQILVVEDDEDLRTVLLGLLAQLGYSVAAAENGREAVAYLREHPSPAVILLDLMMPVMDGAEFCRLRQADPGLSSIPVFLLTARGGSLRQVDGLGIDRVFRKPLEVPELIHAVRSVVAA